MGPEQSSKPTITPPAARAPAGKSTVIDGHFSGRRRHSELGRQKLREIANVDCAALERELILAGRLPAQGVPAIAATARHGLPCIALATGQEPTGDFFSKLLLYDFPANMFVKRKHRHVLREIHSLLENCAVPLMKRWEARPDGIQDKGILFVDSVKELKDRFARQGTNVILATGLADSLYGITVYHFGTSDLPKVEVELIRRVRHRAGLSAHAQIGTAYLEVADPRVAGSPEEGGIGISRSVTGKAMVSYMLRESRKNNVDYLVAYVWDKPFHNLAAETHANVGFENTDIELLHEGQNIITDEPESQTAQVILFDVKKERILLTYEQASHIGLKICDPQAIARDIEDEFAKK